MDSTPSNQEQQQAPEPQQAPEDVLAKAAGLEGPPRGADGRFLPQSQEPAQEAQAAPPPQETQPEGEQPEVQEPVYVADEDLKKKAKIKVQNEELEVTLDEALKGYMRQADYTRKTQETASERKKLEATVQQQLHGERQQYLQALQTLQAAVVKAAEPDLANVDWNKLAAEDPAEYVRKSNRARQVQDALGAIQQQQQQAMAMQAQEHHRVLAQAVAEAKEEVVKVIPEWSDDLYQSILKRGVETYGFSPQEVGQIFDHRAIQVLHDAHQYRLMKDQKPLVEKKVQEAPKVVKPGVPQRPGQTQEMAKAAKDKLRQTGRVEDFAEFLGAMEKRGTR